MTFFKTLASGRDFHFTNPRPEMICLRDIAHHLSRHNCWGDNVQSVSYSLAQRALLVAQVCRLPNSRPYALLFQSPAMVIGSEGQTHYGLFAALGADVVAYERRVLNEAVYPALGLSLPGAAIANDIEAAYQSVLATEFRDIVAGRGAWAPVAKPLSTRIGFMTQPRIEEKFQLALEAALRPFGKVD